MSSFKINPAIMSDSYKATHFLMYPDATQMSAYGGFRKPYPDMNDNRFVFYGIRYIIEN
jgi:nicotinamide phosphoribosyltransferase